MYLCTCGKGGRAVFGPTSGCSPSAQAGSPTAQAAHSLPKQDVWRKSFSSTLDCDAQGALFWHLRGVPTETPQPIRKLLSYRLLIGSGVLVRSSRSLAGLNTHLTGIQCFYVDGD